MKKQFKVAITVLLVCVTGIFTGVTASATGDKSDVIVSLQINDPIMEVNGVAVEIDEGNGTKPIVSDGRTLVPIRAIIEAFGGVVEWEDSTRTVGLSMKDDNIKLVIDSNIAYLNGVAYTLDVAPAVINERTMLPIRFIAEGFNLGVAWEGDTQTVTIIRNSFDTQEYNYLQSIVPAYGAAPYVEINNDIPFFKEYEIIGGSFEYYSDLDELGRCDVCMASVAIDIMPTEERGDISSVKPTGWINGKYDTVPGKYLYNRCHLIGFQLTGENANERNLITGTRYLNVEGMLPFENMIDDYVERTGNHVMYRVTPVFRDSNLVAYGVLLEAYSVEDNGQGISFCVYCYNVQPTIVIDYATGANWLGNSSLNTSPSPAETVNTNINSGIYRTPTGKRYHFDPDCGGKNSYAVTMESALAAGLTPCKKCAN